MRPRRGAAARSRAWPGRTRRNRIRARTRGSLACGRVASRRTAFAPRRPFSSLVHSTTRTVRRGRMPELLHQPRRFPRDDAADAVVGRAGADVPRIEVAAEQHDLVRPLAARESRRRRWPIRRRLRSAPPSCSRTRTRWPRAISRAMRLASSDDTAAAGIGGTPWRVLDAAGVRRAQADRTDRAHEHRHGAKLRGRPRAAGAVGHRLAVGRERRVEEDDAARAPRPRARADRRSC